jgi:glycosyltransferase involved in cell wall biosynthesis
LLHPVDVLFVPAHTVPLIHPARNATLIGNIVALIIQKIIHPFTACMEEHSVVGGPRKTVVTIHGLEYEFCPEAYSLLDRWYMRLSIRFSCRAASTVIAVSENTKRDLERLYRLSSNKIVVIPEGYEQDSKFNLKIKNTKSQPYLLFIGRVEERKNVRRIVEAFGILKEKYRIPHRLVLVGRPGYGYENIQYRISNTKYRDSVIELGYVGEEEKWELLRGADVFVFPSLYEGFGIPVLEAQSVGAPVVTANVSSLPEVGGDGAVFVDPFRAESIAEGIWKVLSEAEFRDGIIGKAQKNVRKFSWERCSEEIGSLLIG